VSELPTVIVEIGDVVLIDLEDLAQRRAQTNASLVGFANRAVGLNGNVTGTASAFIDGAIASTLSFVSNENAFVNKTFIFLGTCALMLLLITIAKCGGCLEQGGSSEMAHNVTVMVITLVTGFVQIPLYTHLLAGLDCTFQSSGMGAHGSLSGFEWDFAAEVFGKDDKASSHKERECYGAWGDPDGDGNWTAFNFMVFGMIGICAFHWPVVLFMMVRPDSERDDDTAVLMLVDEIVCTKQLAGRALHGRGGALHHGWQSPYEGTKCCMSFRNKRAMRERLRVVYESGSAAQQEYDKLIKTPKPPRRNLPPEVPQAAARFVQVLPAGDRFIAPTKNRLELRDYAVRVCRVPPATVRLIDHRKSCGRIRDLDSPALGTCVPASVLWSLIGMRAWMVRDLMVP
jgi:hypothetical protein